VGGLEAFGAPDVGKPCALSELIASMHPKIDTTKMSGLDKLDYDKLTSLHALIASMSLTTPAFSLRMQEISRQLAAPRDGSDRRVRGVEHASDPSCSNIPACANRRRDFLTVIDDLLEGAFSGGNRDRQSVAALFGIIHSVSTRGRDVTVSADFHKALARLARNPYVMKSHHHALRRIHLANHEGEVEGPPAGLSRPGL
jgi:hypothetical protein